MRKSHKRGGCCIGAAVLMLGLCNPALASEASSALIAALTEQLAEQHRLLEAQQVQLDVHKAELGKMKNQLSNQFVGVEELNKSHQERQKAVDAGRSDHRSSSDGDSGEEDGLEFSGYGIVNYYKRDWETDEFAKDGVDTERFIFELEYRFDEHWMAKAEVEYEHGGTGAALELDSQEEFGEFDQEIEKGGEILIEELYIAYNHAQWLNAKFGRFVVPVGRTNKFHKPQDYFTVARSDADAALIPQLWHENGVSLFGFWSFGDWGEIRYEGQLVNGLDSTGFSSRNWISGGHQKRFEEARAEDFALVGRLDYYPNENLQIGGSYYGGETSGNRPKSDLDEDAYVDLWEVDAAWTPGSFVLRGQYLWGRLQNSHLVTDVNRNLSNNLGVKRSPVGSEAQSWFVEAGYDLFDKRDQSLVVFGRYDEYDSMFRTEGLVFDNPRWSRESWTLGVNYLPIPNVVFKAEYSAREIELDDNNKEDTIAISVGFTY